MVWQLYCYLRVCSSPCMEYVVKKQASLIIWISTMSWCFTRVDVILLASLSSLFFVCIVIPNFYHSLGPQLHVEDRRTDWERQTLLIVLLWWCSLFWSVLQVYIIRCNQEVVRGRVTLLTVMVFTLCCSHFLWKEWLLIFTVFRHNGQCKLDFSIEAHGASESC